MWNRSVNHPDPRHRQSSLADAHLTERRRYGTSRERAKQKLNSTMSMVIVGNGQQSRTGGSLSATGEQERRHTAGHKTESSSASYSASKSWIGVDHTGCYKSFLTKICGSENAGLRASFYICTAPGLSLPRNAGLPLSISLRPMNVPQASKPSQQASFPQAELPVPIGFSHL
jgi:hypothetical protein